jgi:outer membrane protein assembly factor BamB
MFLPLSRRQGDFVMSERLDNVCARNRSNRPAAWIATGARHAVIALAVWLFGLSPCSGDAVRLAESSGIEGGLVVHLGCGDGRETAGLRRSERFLVHGLAADESSLCAARTYLQEQGVYGPVSVARLHGPRLPYVDNLVNLLIDSGGAGVSRDEILRVLAPGGVAFVDGQRIQKPWPEEIDDWTHFLHGPDNNAVVQDRRVGIPRSIQWVAEPRWGRTHEEMASMSAAVTAQGRIYSIVDEAPLASIRYLGNWKLVARDAFNGQLLWKRPLASWVDPLRHFRSGPVHLPRRLVAVGDKVYVTLGLAAPVAALDGATGRTVMEYPQTERTEEILVSDGILYLLVGTSEVNRRGGGLYQRGEPAPTDYRHIRALDAATGRAIWTRDFSSQYVLPLTMAVRSGRLFCQTAAGIVCLDGRSGEDLWRTPRQTPARRMAFSAPTLVATDQVVLCADRDLGQDEEGRSLTDTVEWGVHGWNEPGFSRKGNNTLSAYSVQDGRELWSVGCSEGYNSPVDLFVIDDVVWVGANYEGYDLKTGQPQGRIDSSAPRVGMSHPRCYRNKASERFIFTCKSGVEVLSPDQGWLSNNSWLRGTCQYGILPANGLLYAPPDACACFLTVKAPGFFAAAPRRDATLHMPFPDQPVLEQGARYNLATAAASHPDREPPAGAPSGSGDDSAAGAAEPAKTADWPMYRCDPARSGRAVSRIPEAPHARWVSVLGGTLTQPVIVGDTVFVAASDAHTVYALSTDDGREIWRYTADGRIDSSPTIYRDRVLFGSADGWIYCLAADDGELVWRFQAAPQQRLISAYGQLESIWPVHGAVLVQNDTLYATAGRSSYLDGGIVLYRLDPLTGEQLSRTVVHHLDPETGEQLVPEASFNMEGTTSDVLSGDGESVFLKYFQFDRNGQRQEATVPHLYSITGLLGEDWFVRSYWLVGAGMPGAGWGGWASAANAYPSGRILCFDPDVVYGYGRATVAGGPVGHRAETYHLFCQQRTSAARESEVDRKGKPAKKKQPRAGQTVWNRDCPLIVRAMALDGERLALAGPLDRGQKDPDLLAYRNNAEALASFEGRQGAFLQVVSTGDGRQLSQLELPAMPVFDGLSTAGERIYISLKNGSVICLEAGDR